jgi:hypothetical protein
MRVIDTVPGAVGDTASTVEAGTSYLEGWLPSRCYGMSQAEPAYCHGGQAGRPLDSGWLNFNSGFLSLFLSGISYPPSPRLELLINACWRGSMHWHL